MPIHDLLLNHQESEHKLSQQRALVMLCWALPIVPIGLRSDHGRCRKLFGQTALFCGGQIFKQHIDIYLTSKFSSRIIELLS